MELGIVTSVFGKYEISEAARRIRKRGFRGVQFFPQIGGRMLEAEDFTPALIREIRAAFERYDLRIYAVSGGHNIAGPTEEARRRSVDAVKRFISLCPKLGAGLLVTESGTKHPAHNWTDHPDNYRPETWESLVRTYRDLAAFAETRGVVLGVEPHFGKIVKVAADLRRLLDDVGAANLKVVLDPANSVTAENAAAAAADLKEGFRLVGKDIVLAHAKDSQIVDGKTRFVPAGTGILPYGLYLSLLKQYGYDRPLFLEYLDEEGLEETGEFLRNVNVPPFLRALAAGDRTLYEAVAAVQDIVHAEEGALEKKYRLLLSMTADALQNHPAGALACAREALAAGATRAQIAEAMRVVYAAGGLPMVVENIAVYQELIHD
ncbi:MAG: TIM barrel protein [Treponema sp.]|jgi:sugar phosphate isomerase/epimerase|nr:TIM barrel protein [Treponema sp.]